MAAARRSRAVKAVWSSLPLQSSGSSILTLRLGTGGQDRRTGNTGARVHQGPCQFADRHGQLIGLKTACRHCTLFFPGKLMEEYLAQFFPQ